MALINCPECSKEVSDQAATCPNCGFTIKTTCEPTKKKMKFAKILKWFGIIEFIASVICAIYFSGLDKLNPNLSSGAAKLLQDMGGWSFFKEPSVFFYWVGSGFVAFLLFYGFGTVIQLLDDKHNR